MEPMSVLERLWVEVDTDGVNTHRLAPPASDPPERPLFPDCMSSPPEAIVRVWNGLMVTEPPLAMLSELILMEASWLVPAESRALLPAERNPTVSEALSGRTMALAVPVVPALSIVANEVPTPVVLGLIMA